MSNNSEMLEFIIPRWNAPPNIKALTTTRSGGVSHSPYQSLNLGDHVGDQSTAVQQNRQILNGAVSQQFKWNLDASSAVKFKQSFKPQWLRQEHTCNIVDDQTQDQNKSPYDGQFTQVKGVVCTIMTADCMPVFICNQKGTEVALVHAGWRGLADGIIEKVIRLFSDASDELIVHCGPAISQQNFEIGDEVKEILGGSEEYYRPNTQNKGHCFADLYGLLGERMQAIGISSMNYSHANHCTFDEAEKFFSYRREGVTGRMVSLLWIE